MEDSKEITERAATTISNAISLDVSDEGSLEIASEYLKQANDAIKAITEWFLPKVEAANKAHKLLTTERAKMLEPLQTAKHTINKKVVDYQNYLEELQREEDRKAQEKEKARVDAYNKKLREAKERQAKIDEEHQKKVREAQEEQERLKAEAQKKNEPPPPVLELPEPPPPAVETPIAPEPVVEPVQDNTKHNIKGLSFRETWDFKIVNVKEIPEKYLLVDDKKIRKVVIALGAEAEISGIEVFKRKTPIQK